MTNLEKYNQVFMEHFEISAEELPGEVMPSGIPWHIWSCVLFLRKHLILRWRQLIFLLFQHMRKAWKL